MQTQTTAHLRLPFRDRARAWLAQRDPLLIVAAAALPLIGLLLVGALWRAQRPTPIAPAIQPTALPAIMIIATARAESYPTAVPTATPDGQVYAELERLRQRVAELESRPAPQPEVVYVQQPAPAPEQHYTTASQGAAWTPPARLEQWTTDDMTAYRQVVAGDPNLAAHQAAEAASCDRDHDNGTYCQLVRQSIAP